MPLNFQNVPINFEGGIDKTDALLVSPRKLTTLTNCVFDDNQTIVTRPGLLRLNLTAAPSLPAPYARTNPNYSGIPYRLAQNNGSLLLEGQNGLFSKAAYTGGATDTANTVLQTRTDTTTTTAGRTDFARAAVESEFVGEIRTGGTVGAIALQPYLSSDFARIDSFNGDAYSMSAWTELANGVGVNTRIMAFNEGNSTVDEGSDKRTPILDLNIPQSATLPRGLRVLAGVSKFWVFAHDDTTNDIIVLLQLDLSNQTVSYPTFTASMTSTFPSGKFDAIVDPADDLIVVAYPSAVNTLRIAKLNAAVSAESVGVGIAITDNELDCLTLIRTNGSGTLRFQAMYVCASSSTIIRSVGATSAFVAIPEAAMATAAGNVQHVVAVDPGSAYTVSEVFCDTEPTAAGCGTYQFQSFKNNLAGFGGLTLVAKNALIFASPQYDTELARVHLPVCYSIEDIQSGIYVVSAFLDHTPYAGDATLSSVIEARIHWGSAGLTPAATTYLTYIGKSALDVTAGDVIFLAPRLSAQVVSRDGVFEATRQLFQTRVKFKSAKLDYLEVGGTTFLAGACPQIYDGANFAEEGFNHRPVISSVTFGAAASGNLLNTGPYFFQATYIWTDSKGNIVESEPSEIYEGTPSNNLCTYTPTILPCGLTSKQNVGIRIYRSIADAATGALLYLDDAQPGVANDGITDAAITANTLSPSLRFLPNQPMPSCRVAVMHQNRVWCAGGELGNEVFYSQPVPPNLSPRWYRPQFRRTIPAAAGRVVNLVSLDDKLIVFCENRIGSIYGDGPTLLGANDNYSEFIEAVSGYAIPWTEPLSIVRATDGVWFRCGFGFRLLTRNLSVAKDAQGQDLASELDSVIQDVSTQRALISTVAQQVRFYTASDCYVFDLLYGQWSTFNFTSVADATAINNEFYHINLTGSAMFVNTKNVNTDDFLPLTATLETAWIALAGVQGYQRLSRIQLLGQTQRPVPLGIAMTVQAYYDYDGDPANIETLAPTYDFPLITGAAAVPQVYESETQFTVQKCRAIKLKISWVANEQDDETLLSPLRLSSMNLRLGLKQGRAKLADSLRK